MEKKTKKNTSIRVDRNLWKEVKIEAVKRGITVSQLIEHVLRKELGKVMENG